MENRIVISHTPLIFFLPSYRDFATELAQLLAADLGTIERHTFPDGERYQRLCTDVNERSVILVGGSISDESTLGLYDLACACVKYGARRLDLCVPYYGYSTMERAVKSGEVVTAKTRARLFSAIPPAAYGNHIHLLDLHSDGIPHYFEGALMTQHLSATPLIINRLRTIYDGDFILASTDAGRAKQVESLANQLGVDVALIIKRRLSGSQTEVSSMNAHVDQKVVVIYDDMIRTGGSLITAAHAYQQAGAREIYAVCTHGIFPGEAWQRMQSSGLFTQVIATDSHPQAAQLASQGLEIIKTASIFADSLQLALN